MNSMLSTFYLTIIFLNENSYQSEVFVNLEEFRRFTLAVNCLAHIHKDIVSCNQILDGEDWKLFPRNSKLERITKCCGSWKVRQCLIEKAYHKCNSEAVEQIHNLPNNFWYKSKDQECKDYPPGDKKCHLPFVIVIGFLTISAIILGLIIYFSINYCKTYTIYPNKMNVKRPNIMENNSNCNTPQLITIQTESQ
jgi:hypothetical protein